MKSKKVWRYYCEFCKKGGCGKYAMKQHEIHCTMNPNRKCRMCDIAEIEQVPIDELMKLLPEPHTKDDYGTITFKKTDLNELKEVTSNCPNCILATIRQSGYAAYMFGYGYTEECKKFWNDINEKNAERDANSWQ